MLNLAKPLGADVADTDPLSVTVDDMTVDNLMVLQVKLANIEVKLAKQKEQVLSRLKNIMQTDPNLDENQKALQLFKAIAVVERGNGER